MEARSANWPASVGECLEMEVASEMGMAAASMVVEVMEVVGTVVVVMAEADTAVAQLEAQPAAKVALPER